MSTIIIDETHNPKLMSWVDSANHDSADFPIQNLPFGRFKLEGESHWRIGVAIGDQVLDLQQIGLVDHADMNLLMQATLNKRQLLRQTISAGLRYGSDWRGDFEKALLPQASVQMGLPCEIGVYTDFYVGIHHASEIGRQFRPDSPLLPNYKWIPIGYHGRTSTLQVSGSAFRRPMGQTKTSDIDHPVLEPNKRLDIELELGIFVGRPNRQGMPVQIQNAEQHLFGITLFNDWSARDIQSWEYQPLGPFLSKNFASTLSPWIVTMEALAPFRRRFKRPAGDPPPLAYLDSQDNRAYGAIDIQLEVVLRTARMVQTGHVGDVISRSNFSEASYWTAAQLITHHTVNGCALRAGDLLGTGTLSGPSKDQSGSLLELTSGGKHPIHLSNGEHRYFLEDGDTISLRGHCIKEGARRLGFGECSGTALPALTEI